VILNWHALLAHQPRAGTLADGTPLSPTQLLTALCDARLLPAVFRGRTHPLHLGRRRRLFTPTQHAALAARDRGCTFPGCTRPPAACTAHHMRHWAEGGHTDLDNAALLCPYHHALTHREGWTAHLAPNGYPEFLPPPGYDPHQRPRQHLRYRTTPPP
jgi:HNH endonuclease